MSGNQVSENVASAAKGLSKHVAAMSFAEPTTHIYNPLEYAWEGHLAYIRKHATTKKKVIFLGMNPGPYGMVQTGVPFGEVSLVRDWIGIEADIKQPASVHPKRPIEGFDCKKSEVSGRRLWGLFSERFPDADEFFADHFVLNYCPLVFMESTGRNRTPDKLPAEEVKPLYEVCDEHLRKVVAIFEPEWLVGVGAFAETRGKAIFKGSDLRIARVLHPSPASPAANRGWAEQATKQLIAAGIWSEN